MTERKIFGCSYEGNYTCIGNRMKDSDREALRRFRDEGNLFGIITTRDGFEAMANMGEYEEEYDFLVCSTGGCVISRMPLGEPLGAHTRIHTDTINPYFLTELYDLFDSVGMSGMSADVAFRGGKAEAERFADAYDPAKNVGCLTHHWHGGGDYFYRPVNKEALSFVTPFSQCRGYFKNAVTAKGLADEICRRYNGWLRAYAEGSSVAVVPANVTKGGGLARFAEFAGVSPENVWTFGDRDEDISMLSAFHGATREGSPEKMLNAAEFVTASVREAIEIAIEG